jgi:MFS family permease
LAITLCALGALFFSTAHNYPLAVLGRFLMGFGSAFAFTGALLLVSNWFPPERFALIVGLVELMSMLGAATGQTPVVIVAKQWGWRFTVSTLGFLGLGLAFLIWLIVRDRPHTSYTTASPKSDSTGFQHLYQVICNSQTWAIAGYSFAVWAPIAAFGGLWSAPFLVSAYGIQKQAATLILAILWLSIGFSSPLLGWWSDQIQKRNLPLQIASFAGLLGFALIVYVPKLPLIGLYCGLILIGFAAAGQSLAFAVVKDNNPEIRAGTAIGFNNMATVAGGALLQPLVGFLLQFTHKESVHGIISYSASDWQQAFIVFPLCYLVALVISTFYLHETHCRQVS